MAVSFNPDGRYCVMIDDWMRRTPNGWPIHGMYDTLPEARLQTQFQGNPFTVDKKRFSAAPVEIDRQYINVDSGGTATGGIYLVHT